MISQVFLKELTEERLSEFTAEQRSYIEENQENRKTFVYVAVVKLHKFNNLNDFKTSLRRSFREKEARENSPPAASPPS